MGQILNDPKQQPDEALLEPVMGENFANYKYLCGLFRQLELGYQWNYYKDGKSWLCKVQHKKKTVLWLSVRDDCFKLSFYFTEKTRGGVEKLDISPEIKTAFGKQEVTGKLIPLILEIRNRRILDDAEKIITYKMNCK